MWGDLWRDLPAQVKAESAEAPTELLSSRFNPTKFGGKSAGGSLGHDQENIGTNALCAHILKEQERRWLEVGRCRDSRTVKRAF